jgi:nitrite reductase/ring-hydroxylating ferredoxin subunit
VEPMTDSDRTSTWVEVAAVDDLRRRRKVVVPHDDGEILVLMHEGAVHAFDNTCIHRQRSLSKGVVLNGRIVCPGHQWAFDLASGWEALKGECQPTYTAKIEGGRVLVDTASRARRGEPPG